MNSVEPILPEIYNNRPKLKANGIQEFIETASLTKDYFSSRVNVKTADLVLVEKLDDMRKAFKAKFAKMQFEHASPGVRLHYALAREQVKWRPDGIRITLHFIVFRTHKGELQAG